MKKWASDEDIDFINEYLMKKNITQKEFSTMMGLSEGNVSKVLSKKIKLRNEYFVYFCNLIGIDYQKLTEKGTIRVITDPYFEIKNLIILNKRNFDETQKCELIKTLIGD